MTRRWLSAMSLVTCRRISATAECTWQRQGPMRSYIWIGILIGSTIGGLIPGLWGDGVFSYASVLLSGVGALAGLWIGFKLGPYG